MRSKRLAAALCTALACSGCWDSTSSFVPPVVLDPVLDSLFVGDQSPPRAVTYYDRDGVPRTPSPGEIAWGSTDPTVVEVDAATGTLTARKRGLAVISAAVQGGRGVALVVVSNTLDLTLLLDSIYLLPGDTLTVPVVVQEKSSPPTAVVWYEAQSNAVFTIDSASGLITATDLGMRIPYVVHADTIVDTGTVSVLDPANTTDGTFFYSVLGTANSHVGGSIEAVNYKRSNGNIAFRLRGTFAPQGVTAQVVHITLPDSLAVADSVYAIDSISPAEADQQASPGQFVANCTPPRPWAIWSVPQTIIAYSRRGGTLGITQIVTVQNRRVVSGRFTYPAQRLDLYDDPLGVLSIRGSFVAPLESDPNSCPL